MWRNYNKNNQSDKNSEQKRNSDQNEMPVRSGPVTLVTSDLSAITDPNSNKNDLSAPISSLQTDTNSTSLDNLQPPPNNGFIDPSNGINPTPNASTSPLQGNGWNEMQQRVNQWIQNNPNSNTVNPNPNMGNSNRAVDTNNQAQQSLSQSSNNTSTSSSENASSSATESGVFATIYNIASYPLRGISNAYSYVTGKITDAANSVTDRIRGAA